MRFCLGIALALMGAAMAGCGATVYPVEGRTDLPPCERGVTQDCSITSPAMAIDMMTRPPNRETQPNAYYQYRRYECERDREGYPRALRPFCAGYR
jgi:hypothetical protein